ncbi:Uncharacterized protein Rs2_11721 [Raphanus sativus]|nr:Uncharacterized protein Rs2_11721 [Raphanus sativus]
MRASSGIVPEFMILSSLPNVTGWMCNVLVTSSLLKAFGVGSFYGSSPAAAINGYPRMALELLAVFLLVDALVVFLTMILSNGAGMLADFIGSAGRFALEGLQYF